MREIILKKILDEKIKNSVKLHGNCPSVADSYSSASEGLNNVLSVSNIPEIAYQEEFSASKFFDESDNISSWLLIAANTMNSLVADYESISNKYNTIAKRIFNESSDIRDKIDALSGYVCRSISTRQSNQADTSICGKIGNYICLPFFVRSATMYEDSAQISTQSSGETVFTNESYVSNIPLNEPLSVKAESTSSESSVTVNVTLNSVTANLVYAKFLNKAKSIKVSLYNSTDKVYEKTFSSNEVFANFDPITFDLASFTVTYQNPNKDKPFSVVMSNLSIFTNIKFAKTGSFESKPMTITLDKDISYINLEYRDLSDSDSTSSIKMMSVSTDKDKKSFNIVSDDQNVGLSSYKFRYAREFTGITADYDSTAIGDKKFFISDISSSDDNMWNMDFENALMFNGLNVDYGETSQLVPGYYGQHFENWSKNENYWETMVSVTEDDVFIDIGTKTCFINGVEKTGRFEIRRGISKIRVHEKDIDFNLGKEQLSDMSDKDDVYSDPLFPFNFAYIFAGLPEYDSEGDIEGKIIRRFKVSNSTTLSMEEPFIPLSVEIKELGTNREYKMQFTEGVSTPGTFSIEPNKGRIRIFPFDTDSDSTVQIKYRRASTFKKPVGVLFNRLLTFVPIKVLLSVSTSSNTESSYNKALTGSSFFTIHGDLTTKELLIEDTSGLSNVPNALQHSHIIFNRSDEDLYVATKINMSTENRYLTPIIKDIYLSVE